MLSCLSLSLVRQIMLSFDLSTTNILLIVAAVALFIVFVIVLMKLNPSTQKEEEPLEREIILERHKPFQIQQTVPPKKPFQAEPSVPPKPLSVAKENIQVTVEKPLVIASTTLKEPSIQMNLESKAPTVSQSKEVLPKPEKIVPPKAATSSPSRRDCLHQFGYLRTLPKNAPIPDECLGCQRVVECLVEARKR